MTDEATKETTEDSADTAPQDSTPLKWSDIKGRKTRSTKTIPVQLDGQVAAQLEELQSLLAAAKMEDRKSDKSMAEAPKAPMIQAQIDDLIESAQATSIQWTVASIGRFRYEKFVADCPPNQVQKKRGDTVNVDKFAPLLIAASSIDPILTEDEAKEMWTSEEWNQGELERIVEAARAVNQDSPDIPLSRGGIEETIRSVLNSITAANAGSPTASS